MEGETCMFAWFEKFRRKKPNTPAVGDSVGVTVGNALGTEAATQVWWGTRDVSRPVEQGTPNRVRRKVAVEGS